MTSGFQSKKEDLKNLLTGLYYSKKLFNLSAADALYLHRRAC